MKPALHKQKFGARKVENRKNTFSPQNRELVIQFFAFSKIFAKNF